MARVSRLGVTFDVAIVGAGPAGCTAAIRLAESGARVVVLEKETLPRYKTCGGGLVARARAALPIAVDETVEVECRSVRCGDLEAGVEHEVTRDVPLISMTMRDRLDGLLAGAASASGAEVRAPCAVRGVSAGAERVDLETAGGRVSARFVIAADGALGAVAASVAPVGSVRTHAAHRIPALEWEIERPSGTQRAFDSPRFDFGAIPRGYAWVFPKRDHLSVGILSARRGNAGLRVRLEAYLRAVGLGEARVHERHGFVIPVRPLMAPLAIGRVLLTGDAAGLADPVTAEGISFAVRSGAHAAAAVSDTGGDPARAGPAYAGRLAGDLLPELRVARWLARVLYGSPVIRRRFLRRHGAIAARAMARVFTGEESYTTLARGRARILRHLVVPRPRRG